MKKIAASIIFAFLSLNVFSLPISFNSNLSEEERATVEEGKILIKNTGSWKKLCLTTENEGFKEIQKELAELKPAYLAEIVMVKPYEGNENLIEEYDSMIMNIEDYAGIPYYSVQHKKWFDLYSSAKIISSKESENGSHLLADLNMEPFGTINMDIKTEKNENYYLYQSTNLNNLRFKDKINCVGEKKMKSMIVIYKDNDKWILYGVGAVDAPLIPFLKGRIETSFMNRIKSFCSYFFDKM